MTSHPPDRRTVLMTAGAAAVAAAAGPSVAQATEIRGSVVFDGGAAIPQGRLEVYLEAPGAAQRRVAETRLDSDGRARTLAFSLSPPAIASTSLRIVARLEGADGWLLARGSAPIQPGAPVAVTLNPVTY
jgi:hypothetical protein